MKKLLAFGVFISLSILLWSGCLGPLSPIVVRVATTDTIYASTSDGYIWGDSTTYSTARSTSADCNDTWSEASIGQRYNTSNWHYYVRRTYLSFDTSGIPDDATVSSATLYVKAKEDNSSTDFEVKVYRYAWSSALCSSREANYDGAYGGSATLEGTLRNTADGWAPGAYYSMAVSTAGINVTGDTRYCLVSSRDVNNNAPTQSESVLIYTANETGTGSDPYLEVVYTVATATPTDTDTPTATATDTSTPTPTDTVTPTATNTLTPTATNTATPTATPTDTSTPTPTPLCPVAILDDTTWGPGLVNVDCNVGIGTNTTLTITAGTTVQMMGDYRIDVQGTLYAVGTVTEPITFTHATEVTKSAWAYIYLRGDPSTLEYCNIYYGRGVNDEAGSTLRYCKVMTCAYGLATMSASDVASCTFQYDTYGLLMYLEASPVISYCNILSNTWNAYMDQITSVAIPDCWWGSDPPDDALIWDYGDDFTLGLIDTTGQAAGWIDW